MNTTLFGWGPLFDTPSPSPYVMKCEVQLTMLEVPFERAIADLESVPKHKAPYVRHGERVIEDSTFIRAYFEAELGRDLDAALSDEQRGLAWGLERLLEDRLAHIVSAERWLDDENFRRGPRVFFAGVPEAHRAAVIAQVRAELQAAMTRIGLCRHSRAERMILARRDITAVARALRDKAYLFGDTPSAVDAAAFGVLTACGTRFFDSELPDMVDEHANLRPYLARVSERFLRTSRWPALG